MNDAVAGVQGDAAAAGHEARQFLVGEHVHRLGIGGGVAERLHHQVRRETQAGQVLELVPGHRPGGVLGAHGGHVGLAVGSGAHARDAAGAADHFLGQGVALAGLRRHRGLPEQGGGGQPQGLPGPGGEAAPDDEGDPAAGAHFIEENVGFHLETGDHLAVLQGQAVVGPQLHHVAHGHGRHVQFDGQRPGVLHGVEEDGGNLGAQADPAEALVGHVGDVLAGEPQHGVGGGLAGGAGAHHVADVGHQVALGLEGLQEPQRPHLAGHVGHDAGPGVLEHGQGVQRDVGPAPGVRGR